MKILLSDCIEIAPGVYRGLDTAFDMGIMLDLREIFYILKCIPSVYQHYGKAQHTTTSYKIEMT